MTHDNSVARLMLRATLGSLTLAVLVAGWIASAQDKPVASSAAVVAADEAAFRERVQPLMKTFCVRCHTADNMESGIRVDQLTAALEDRQLPLWKGIQKQVADGDMPPADEPQPTAEQRKSLIEWITRAMTAARSRPSPKNGSVRRLTVAQYRNTLRDLLGLQEDLTDALPPDGISKDGFDNNAQTLLLSPLQVESYFDIAEKALDLCIVDENTKPVIQNFRMDFGASINPQPCPDKLILGANNALLNNADFLVTELQPTKPFDYQPFAIWLNSAALEIPAYKQLADPMSDLSANGRELCAEVERATGRPTYYFLMRYWGRQIGEVIRCCPGCGGKWQTSKVETDGRPFHQFHFRCQRCRLVSHCANSYEDERHARIGEFKKAK